MPTSVLASGGQSSSNNKAYGRSGTTVRTGTGVKLRTLTTAIELDDDSSTKNFADRNYASGRTFADVETGSSGSQEEEASRSGPRTVIEAGPSERETSSRSGPRNTGGIHIKNEMSISYETR